MAMCAVLISRLLRILSELTHIARINYSNILCSGQQTIVIYFNVRYIIPMDLQFYITTHTKEQVERLCSLANTKPSWLSLCMRNHGRLGLDVAVHLEAASRALSEYDGDYLTFDEIFNVADRVKVLTEEIKRQIAGEQEAEK